jgi:addiction module HigA family antidote
MLPEINDIKGVHPGVILEREFRKRGIGKSVFAREIGVYPGIITDITKQRRGMNAHLAIRIENALGAEEGYFMVIQAYYSIAREREKTIREKPKPNLSLIRKALFWDVNFDNIDFNSKKRYVIERVFERGNNEEINEIMRFYGKKECIKIIRSAKRLNQNAIINAERYLNIQKDKLLFFNPLKKNLSQRI